MWQAPLLFSQIDHVYLREQLGVGADPLLLMYLLHPASCRLSHVSSWKPGMEEVNDPEANIRRSRRRGEISGLKLLLLSILRPCSRTQNTTCPRGKASSFHSPYTFKMRTGGKQSHYILFDPICFVAWQIFVQCAILTLIITGMLSIILNLAEIVLL